MRRDNYPLNGAKRFETLPQCLEYMKTNYDGQTALTFFDEDGEAEEWTFGQFASDVDACMEGLCASGLTGTHMALISENCYEWVVAFFAVVCSGGTAVPIDVEQTAEEIQKAVRHADCGAMIISETYELILNAQKIPESRFVIRRDGGTDSFDALLSLGRTGEYSQETERLAGAVQDSDQALIVYTSGTTNTAKPVVLTHGNLMYNAWGALAMVDVGTKVFTPLPFYHTYALTCGMLGCLAQGIHFSSNGFLKTMMRDIRRFEPETLISVPMITDNLLKAITMEERKAGVRDAVKTVQEKAMRRKKWHMKVKSQRNQYVDKIVGKKLRLIISGGAHLNDRSAEELEVYGIQVLQGYGITECGPLISANRNGLNKIKSVGLVLPETEIKFAGGEILVKGPSVFSQYYKAEGLTKEALVNGWFHTGDIGYMDKKGFLYICGRKKNLIVFSNGKKVVPEELERYLSALPLIKEVMVYGASSGQTADEVTLSAMVYPDPDATREMSSFEILEKIQEDMSELNKNLPLYKRVQSIKLTEAEFGKTGIRKIKRNEVSL